MGSGRGAPKGHQRCSSTRSALPVTRTVSLGRQEEIDSGQTHEHGRPDGQGSRLQTSDVAGDGTTTATVLAFAPSSAKARMQYVAAGMNPMDLKRGIDKAVEARSPSSKKIQGEPPRRDRPGRHHLANWRRDHRHIIADAMDKVGKEGVITVEEGKSLEPSSTSSKACSSTAAICRPYFITNPENEGRVRDNPILMFDKKIATSATCCPPGAGGRRAVPPDHRRGRRRRSLATLVVNTIRGIAEGRGRQGPGRRPPQGHARRHRHPDRRQPSSPKSASS